MKANQNWTLADEHALADAIADLDPWHKGHPRPWHIIGAAVGRSPRSCEHRFLQIKKRLNA